MAVEAPIAAPAAAVAAPLAIVIAAPPKLNGVATVLTDAREPPITPEAPPPPDLSVPTTPSRSFN